MSAGGIIGTTITTIGIGCFTLPIAKVIDIINQSASFYNLSASTVTTMFYLELIFIAAPFLFFFANIIHHIIISNNESTGFV